MSEETPQASNSLIAIDVGSANTRAQFFDAVEGRYRFVAAGEAPSTSAAPAHDLNLGVLEAITQLQSIIGRQLLNERGLMVAKGSSDLGVNSVTATFSGGPQLKIVTVGLLDAVSLNSVNNLVNSAYGQVVESLSLNDRRSPESIIDAICANLPDLIVIAGGTNRGASRSVVRLANYLALALKLVPQRSRPEVLFVGNENLQEEIQELLGTLTQVHVTANIRPSLDVESLGPAENALSKIYFGIQGRKVLGVQQLNGLAGGNLQTSAQAFGRAVRFLSTVIDAPKGMLGVDLGASSTTVAAAFSGQLNLRVFADLGMGRSLSGMIAETHLQQIMRWLPMDLDENRVLDYLYNKPLFPHTLPANEDELAIEAAAARQVVRLAIGKSLPLFPANAIYPLAGTVPWFDRILVSGSTLARHPRLDESLMIALDAIQPVGIATIILDQNNLAASVGASASLDPLMAVQVLESNAFMNLGTVISPTGSARKNSAVLRVQMVRDGQKENVVEIKEGNLQVLSLPAGKAADLYIQPLQNMNIGLGAGRGGWVRRVVGGAFGIIFDTRGRPVQVPTSFNRRQETLAMWRQALVG
jgi:uncharacterized protein (TIGR01319 family)